MYVCMSVPMTFFYCDYSPGVTGNALPDDVGHFISAGANEVVLKPLTKAKIIDALCRY